MSHDHGIHRGRLNLEPLSYTRRPEMSKASSARDDSGPFPEWQTGARIAERRQESDGTLGRTSPNRIRIANLLIRIEKWVSHVSPPSRVRESGDIFLMDGRNTHRIEIMRFLEAGVGIEPASTALQESGDSFINKILAPFHFRHFATFPGSMALFWRVCPIRGESTYVISGLLPSGRAPDPQRSRSLVNGLPLAPEVSVFSSLTDMSVA
jgi:hypothetical protein